MIETIDLNTNCIIHPQTMARMVRVPAGSFLMGSDGGGEFEAPIHRVELSDFWIDVTPITNASFQRFFDATNYVTEAERAGSAWGYRDGRFQLIDGLNWRSFADDDRREHPIVLVTWNDALSYCEWAGLRLPTEAEWEYCARGGREQNDFPWGDQIPDGRQSNFARSASEVPPTSPVGVFGANPFGISDLVGNVWQWCADWYAEDYYAQSPEHDPKGPPSGRLRVRRGGSWNVIQGFRLRCSNRGSMEPGKCAPNVGFRAATSKSPGPLS